MNTKNFKPVTYRLTNDRVGESVLIKTGRNKKLFIFDDDKKENRTIRHCPNEKSIFIDEQSSHAIAEPVVFTHGLLEITSPRQLITKEFLDKHPDNASNGGAWFELIDDEAEDQEFVDIEETRLELKSRVRAKAKEEDGIYALQAEVSVITGSYVGNEMPVTELKSILYKRIDDNYEYFLDDNSNIILFEDSFVKTKHLALRALDEQILVKDNINRRILWASDRQQVYQAPAGTKLVDSFADFLMTDEGMLVGQEIAKRS